MQTSIYTRHRFHSDIIRRAVWMYFRFNLSFRDVEELMIERGVEVSYETIRRWVDKFGSTRSVKNAQKLLSAHSQIYNLFNYRRHLISRNTLRKFRAHAENEWNFVTASTCA